MSERQMWWALYLSLMWLIAGVLVGALERVEGRAEMKRWQDEWYAMHPVVKEVWPVVEPRSAKLGITDWHCWEFRSNGDVVEVPCIPVVPKP